jgi:dihydroorotate dehydrogenase
MTFAEIGFRLVRPLLERVDAETAHDLTLKALKWLPVASPCASNPRLSASLFGLEFANPLGLAAGFDKNASVIDQVLSLGFGFTEVGTTTPEPQAGNPQPRLFRLAEDFGVINRMGFNNRGHSALHQALMNRSRGGIVGVNLGANKDAADRYADFAKGIETFAAIADYMTINVSSPNTPGLRGMQGRQELDRLLTLVNDTLTRISRRTPVLLKIAPDLSREGLADIAALCPGRVDGVIISNTTLSRHGLACPSAQESGGLSGRPLFELSSMQLARFYLMTKGKIPLIGAGGISDAPSAWAKICAGASLLQLYTGLVYSGPRLIRDILSGLSQQVDDFGLKHYSQAIGCQAEAIAEGQFFAPFHHKGNGT